MKLNLGCGRDYRAGWENWDRSHKVKADEYLDISASRWPSQENQFEEIYCSGVLEQIGGNEKFLHVLNECWRVLIPGGMMTVIVPSAKFSNAFKDPFDCRRFIEETFMYFDWRRQEYKLYGSVYGFKPWEVGTLFTNPQGIITAVMRKYEA